MGMGGVRTYMDIFMDNAFTKHIPQIIKLETTEINQWGCDGFLCVREKQDNMASVCSRKRAAGIETSL